MNPCTRPATPPFRTDAGNVVLFERRTVLASHASMKAQMLLTRAALAGKAHLDVNVAEALHLPGPPIWTDWFGAMELAVELFGVAANGACESVEPDPEEDEDEDDDEDDDDDSDPDEPVAVLVPAMLEEDLERVGA